MAIQIHKDGDRLIETKLRFIANMEDLIAGTLLMTDTDYDLNVGKHSLIPFRRSAQALLEVATSDLTAVGMIAIEEGDRIYTIRQKLNTNFAILDALAI